MKWPSINWGYYPKIGRWHPKAKEQPDEQADH